MKTLYLIPVPIGTHKDVFPKINETIINEIDLFIVENAKTVRAFLKDILTFPIQQANIVEIYNGKDENACIDEIKKTSTNAKIALLSEAGCPAVADPGAIIVKKCHELGIKIVPLVGPSSIILSLMASGLNGQSFTFNGYLPQKGEERTNKLTQLEKISSTHNQTQIFIETPYRNNQMLKALVDVLNANTLLCVASNLHCDNQLIKTQSIAAWKKEKINFDDMPTIFLFLANGKVTNANAKKCFKRF